MGETKENNIQQTSEQDLWQEEAAMMHIFSRNRKNNLRTLLSLFKGHYGALAGSIFFFIIKHSPTWVLPIVTANIKGAIINVPQDIEEQKKIGEYLFISESQSRVLNIIETARGKGDIQKAVDEIFNQNERHHYGVLFSWNFSIIIIKKCI